MKFLLVGINAKYIHTNLALYYLEAYARKYSYIFNSKSNAVESDLIQKCSELGALNTVKSSDNAQTTVQIVEYTINQPLDKIMQEIYLEKPDVIGFSCYIWNIRYINELTDMLKTAMPDVDIWLGGPEVSYNSASALARMQAVKGIMIGEGEETFKELLELYDKHLDRAAFESTLSGIKGLTYRKWAETDLSPNCPLVQTPLRPYLDLSDVPFPYEDLSKFENRMIYYETSRGCPFNCKYCLSSVDKKVRLRDMSLVEKELQFFIDNKVPQVKFVDRTFNCNHDHALSIWRYIKAHDNGITNFHFEVAADLLDDEMIAEISDMRPQLIQLEIGVQSTNDITIGEIARKTDLDLIRDRVARINAFHNTHLHLDLIAGLPYEDYETFGKSFDDVYNMKPSQLQLGFLKVLHGSAMEYEAADYGIEYRDMPPYEVIKTKWLSYADVCRLKDIEDVVETYYNSGQFVNILKVIMRREASPFKFFDKMAQFFRAHGYFDMTPSREKKYQRLLAFLEYEINNVDNSGDSADCNNDSMTISDNNDCYSNVSAAISNSNTVCNNDNMIVSESRDQYIAAIADVLVIDYYTREKAKKHPAFSNNKYEMPRERNAYVEYFDIDIAEFIRNGNVVANESKLEVYYDKTRDFLNNYPFIVI